MDFNDLIIISTMNSNPNMKLGCNVDYLSTQSLRSPDASHTSLRLTGVQSLRGVRLSSRAVDTQQKTLRSCSIGINRF